MFQDLSRLEAQNKDLGSASRSLLRPGSDAVIFMC